MAGIPHYFVFTYLIGKLTPANIRAAIFGGLLIFILVIPCQAGESNPPNVLLITVDDMNWDSVGVFGCKVPNITPHIDRLARQGMIFQRSHVTIAVCQPTRAVWMTGRYPIHNGARGFEPINKGVPTMPEILKNHGFLVGIMAKVPHVVPSRGSVWDWKIAAKDLRQGRDPDLYYQHAREFFRKAKKNGKPFFLMANSQDPHRPFAGSDQEKNQGNKKKKAGIGFPQVKNPYRPDQVQVPGFLPDLPQVRREIAEYFSSVHRADNIVGAVLRALWEEGLAENTIVIFLSDHGMALPFAKTNCYYHSTRTPLIVRWPGRIQAGSVDRDHFVSGIDLMPTILDMVKVPQPKGMDGKSFLPVLRGQKQSGRDSLLTVFHKTSARKEYEMRAYHTKQYLYIVNPWSDGKTIFRNESMAGRTMKAMVQAAKSNAAIAERVKLFLYRVPEELYDINKDPDCLHNLVNEKTYQPTLRELQKQMLESLQALHDPVAKNLKEFLNK